MRLRQEQPALGHQDGELLNPHTVMWPLTMAGLGCPQL